MKKTCVTPVPHKQFIHTGSMAVSLVRRVVAPMIIVASVASLFPAVAATYQWDANGSTANLGGTGTWNGTTNAFWDQVGIGLDAGADSTLINPFVAGDIARFAGTAGTATLNSDLNLGSGSLQFNTTGYTITGSGTITATALDAGSGISATINSIIGGTNINKTGTGTVVLHGNNSYTGTTTVTAGVLTFGKTAALYGGTNTNWTAAKLTVNSGATLAFRVGGTGEFTNADITNTLLPNLTTGLSSNGFKSGSFIGFDTTTASGGTFTVADSIGDSTGTGGGALGLNKLGTNTLMLSGTNSYTGGTTVNGGTLNVSGDQSGANGGWALNAGTVNFQSGSIVAIAAGKSVSLANSPSGKVLNVAGIVTNAGSLGVNANGTLNINSGGDWLQSGTMSVRPITSGAGATMNVNAGGTFTYTGTTAIGLAPSNGVGGPGTLHLNGGTFITGKNFDSGSGGSGSSANLTFSSGGTLRLTANVAILATLSNGTTAPFNIQLGAKNTASSSGNIDTNGFSTTITQGIVDVVSQTGSLTKLGAGTLTLSGQNTFSGGTTVNGGTLALSFGGSVTADVLKSGSALTLGGGTLQMTGANTATQSLALTTTASSTSRILLDAGKALNLGASITTGANSALNFNTAAGGANAAMSTVGTSIAVLTGQTAGNVINTGFTVTDSTGFGLATVNGSNQVVRLTGGNLLPATGAVVGTDYRIDNNNNGPTAPGSSSLVVTSDQSAKSITVDTTAAGGTLTVDSGVTLRNSVWNFGNAGSGTNTYVINGLGKIAAATGGGTTNFNNFNAGAVTIAAEIADNTDPSSVVFGGTGTTVLTGANTYTGATTISSGTLQIGNGGTTGSLAGGAVTNNSTLIFNRSNSFEFANEISGTGSVTQAGSGTTTLSGTNTYTGGTTISGGTLQISGSGTLGGTTGSLAINTGGTLDLGSTTQNVGAVTLGGGTIQNGTLTGSSYTSTGGTISAALGGFGAFTQTSGTTTLSGTNTYIGGTTISGGTLTIQGDQSGATGSYIVNAITTSFLTFASGATIHVIAGNSISVATPGTVGATLSSAATVTNDGSLTLGRAGGMNLTGGTWAQSGALSVGGNGGYLAALNVSGGIFTYTGSSAAIGYNGNLESRLWISGTGEARFQGTGDVQIGRGAVNTGLNAIAGEIAVNAGGTLTTQQKFVLNVEEGRIALGGGTIKLSADLADFSDNLPLVITSTAATTFNTKGFSTTIDDTISSTAAGGITKTGAGTLKLTGDNTYTGGTTVSEGALQVGSSGVGKTGTGAVSVKLGSLILGTGRLQGSSFTAESGSTVQAGDGIAQGNYGTLNIKAASGSGVYDFQSGSTTILGINPGGTGDLLNIDGNLNGTLLFNGNLQVTTGGYVPNAVETFNLLDWVNISTLTFNDRFKTSSYSGYLRGNGDDSLGFDLPDISTSDYAWDISQFTTNGSISTVLAAPEPSRALLILLGMAGLLSRRRRLISRNNDLTSCVIFGSILNGIVRSCSEFSSHDGNDSHAYNRIAVKLFTFTAASGSRRGQSSIAATATTDRLSFQRRVFPHERRRTQNFARGIPRPATAMKVRLQ